MSTQTIEKVDASIEQELNLVLVRNNLTKEKLAALNDRAMKYGGEIVSEAQYKEVLAVSQEIGKDVAIAKKNLKEMDRHRIDSNKAWMDMIREVMAKVEEPLVLIGAPMGEYRAKKKKEEEDRLAAVKQENDEREQKVIELGFVRHPGPPEHRYILEDMVVGITSIINVPHGVWTNTYNDMRLKSEEVNAAKAEQEELERLDAAMAEQRQREQDAREAELAQREADIKQKEEAANAALEQSRKNELFALGAELLDMPAFPLHQYTEDKWPEEVRMVRVLVGKRNQDREREALINERVEKLKAAGWEDTVDGNGLMLITESGDVGAVSYVWFKDSPDEISSISSDHFGDMITKGRAELARRQQEADKAAREKMEAEIAERQEAERLQAIEDEAKRVAALGDAERWEEWIILIKSNAPSMVTRSWQDNVVNLLSTISESSSDID